MMDRLDELRLFVAVTEAGSLAAGGRRLGHSPPAVTRALAALEERLGVRLLERSTRRSRPTPEGERLAAQARRVLADYAEAMAEASGEAAVPRGRLRVGAPLVFGQRHVAPVLATFLEAHPRVTAELLLSDRNADLVEEGIDCALRIALLLDSTLVARRIGETRPVLVASPAYLAVRGAPATPAALAEHETVHFANRAGPAEWGFQAAEGAAATVRITPRLIVNTAEASLAAVRAGRGITAALCYQVAEELLAGSLVRLLPAWEPPPRPISLVFPTARLLAPRVRAFLDFAAPAIARRLVPLPP